MDGDRERQFSGVYVRMVVQFLRERHDAEVLRRVLAFAGEDRPIEVLLDDAVWASYDQIRRLFEATASMLDGPSSLTDAALATPVDSGSSAELAQSLQDLGSPSSLLRAALSTDSAFGLSTVRHMSGEEVTPDEWLVRTWFTEGFDSFPEFCAFETGVLSLLPRLFGLPAGDAVEETCCCSGDECCTFRLRWTEDEEHRAEQERLYFETRSHLLESRLAAIQQTVADLVSAPDPDAGLSRVLEAASRSMYAPCYVLVTDPRLPIRPRLLAQGVDPAEAGRIGAELLEPEGRTAPGRLCVEVASNRTRYGWLAAVDPGSREYLEQERRVFASYAALAAAALDSATALDEARREATTSATLLELSRDLAALSGPEQIATQLAESIRRVVDCDRSLVLLTETDRVLVGGADGFPARVEARLRQGTLRSSDLDALGPDLDYLDAEGTTAVCLAHGLPTDQIPVAAATVPMTANEEMLGCLVVSVMKGPERLRESNGLNDALRGIAAQGAVALGNARLVARIRHQALHDELTGLGNRALMIQSLEQALSRGRRLGHDVAALFIDLDGFKEINDTLGHAAGDEILNQLGGRLHGVLRSGDTVGRIGGDEFVAVLEGECLDAGPEAIAERVMREIRRPFRLCGGSRQELWVTASMGIAVGDRPSADEMLRDADLALYRAKASGKDCHVVYSSELAESSSGSSLPVWH